MAARVHGTGLKSTSHNTCKVVIILSFLWFLKYFIGSAMHVKLSWNSQDQGQEAPMLFQPCLQICMNRHAGILYALESSSQYLTAHRQTFLVYTDRISNTLVRNPKHSHGRQTISSAELSIGHFHVPGSRMRADILTYNCK